MTDTTNEKIINLVPEQEKVEESTVNLQNEIDILQNLLGEDDTDFGFDAVIELLALEEEHFRLLAEPFLIEFESNLNNNKEVFAYLAKRNDYRLDEFQTAFQEIREEINESDQLSETKKDFLIRFIALMFDAFFMDANGKKLISIPFQLIREVNIPKYANDGDAGMDLYSPEEYTINPGETVIIPTGIKMAIPQGYAVLIQPRSGQSAKTKLRIANTPGLIDSGYRDEIGVIVENIEPAIKDIKYKFDDYGEIHIESILHGEPYTITKGQRFAQMRLVEVPTAALFEVESVGEIGEDRNGGFGSTGTE